MKRNNHNINDRMKMARSLCCLLLFFMAGSLMAQSDRQYVIVKGDHYLSHEGNTPQDASSFSTNCIWYSPNNYNYYFMVGTTQKYLKAPLEKNGTISVDSNPGTQTLNNNTLDYFFYDWDNGLARGIQHFGGTCPTEYHSSGSECWQVVWLSYESNQWKMSSTYGYEPTENSARFLRVTETEHAVAVSGESGGVGNLTSFSMNVGDHQALNGTASPYTYTTTPAYTHYHIDGLVDPDHSTNISERNYYYYNNLYNTSAPNSTTYSNLEPSGYAWSISCDGNHLSFAENSNVFTATGATPTLYYRTANTSTSHKTATLTLTVTYEGGATQTRTATVTVRTQCQNPTVLDDDKVITYVGVTVSWLPTAESYEVSWKKDGTDTWSSITVGDVTSYTITGLDYNTDYHYKVSAICGGTVQSGATEYPFKTLKEPGLMVNGAIFGGGRMANVTGKTEVIIVNCDSIGDIYGGNDIAGEVQGANGSTIVLGVDAGGTYASYGTTPNNGKIRVTSVYGGGNGYYAYNGTSFVAADDSYTSETVAVGGHVNEMTQSHHVGDVVWTNTGTNPKTLNFPSIVKTSITVTNDKVKVDSIFGGAKNAFLTYDDYNYDGSLITVDGGTILAVFGGNNFGGDQGRGKHHIVVNGTTTDVVNNSIVNSATEGYGRDFGIRYLFGGGNKVYGSTTNVQIFGGQCDTIFAGGNSADVYAANMTVDCAIGTGSGTTYGHVYSNAIASYDGSIKIKDNYGWDGYTGIYNVRTLFGGNNMAAFDSKLNGAVPTITLTSGSIGTVYGGGNAGDMWGLSNDNGSGGSLVINGDVVKYGTHVKMNSATILIDNLYGGCQMSNVLYSTWVELLNGHVGTVYGGCNVSGDVGSTLVNPNAPTIPVLPADQEVFGGTYVVASGGIVYKNLFAGGNGYYHCLNNAGCYISGLNYTNNNFVGYYSPTHNETHVVVNTGATVKGSVYAGGNLARVGFTSNSVGQNPYPQMVGLSSVRMSGGTVNGSVYGGGNMADVNGSCEVQVSGGTIGESLYGGNDRLGKVAVPYSNRILPEDYWTASDNQTSLLDPKVYTYVGLTGNPSITNVYGGGNGDYKYFTSFEDAAAYTGPKEIVVTCDTTNKPIQQKTFVDIGVNGGDATGAHIGTVYGGGDGVTVTGFVKVFLNVKTNPIGYSNIGTIFGGNNKGPLAVPADIILLNGQVNTVYGGCNEGAMTATGNALMTIGGYENIGSYVRLINEYDPDGEGNTYGSVSTNYKIMDAVYGGCRMNGVTNNSLVLVDGGDFSTVPLYGGSDISGTVSGFSRVAVVGGTVGNVYGGGNGDYTYPYSGATTPPSSVNSGVDVKGGTVATGVYGGNNAKGTITGNVEVNITGGTIGASTSARANIHGGGYGSATQTQGNVTVNIGATNGQTPPTYSGTAVINGDVYGGSALGQVSASDKLTQVNFYKGTINGDVYGGGLGNNDHPAEVSGAVEVNVRGGVFNAANGALGGGRIFGGNNAKGTPLGNVNVNIYATDHGVDFEHNLYPTAPSGGWTVATLATNALTQTYAIGAVYGGGNEASYTPAAGKSATVHVYSCDNTINDVYGGGNAANVGTTGTATNTFVIVDGGRINRIFGGGNGEVTAANIYGTATTTVNGGLVNQIFGCGNMQGTITTTQLNLLHPTNGCEDEVFGEVFGGANQAAFEGNLNTTIPCGVGTIGDIYGGSNQANINGNVTLNIQGGTFTNVFGGSKGVQNGAAANIDGNVTLNLQGGEITNAFGGSNYNGNITGNILVNVVDLEGTCGLQLTNVYGGGNLTAYSPDNANSTNPVVNVIHIAHADGISGSVFGGAKGATATVTANPIVNIGYDAATMSGYVTGLTIPASPRAYVKGNVFGGGDAAAVTGSTTVNVFKGEIVHKLVGGGNNIATSSTDPAGVSGNVTVNITGGEICTEPTGIDAGIYGGCNTSGTVSGNVTVNITGSESSPTTIGTIAALEYAYDDPVHPLIPVSVHGGGYGAGTEVKGNVTVNFGEDDGTATSNCEYLKLYGDLYGGSALGTVNDGSEDLTTVNVLNGIIDGGNVFGGGLGDATHAAKVWGVVHVNIGLPPVAPSTDFRGQASFPTRMIQGVNIGGDVFGGNNKNGSPQQDVWVDVYKTAHTEKDLYTYLEIDRTYAIADVYGGGKKAVYAPDANPEKKLHTYIHNCDNTVGYVYGGCDAADAQGTEVKVDGGRFNFIFGGGNGQTAPANITGNVDLYIYGGRVGWYFVECNLHGQVFGQAEIHIGAPHGHVPYCGELEVENYYFGANEALTVGGLENVIECENASEMVFKKVFAGSRLAVIYGDVKLTVRGGTIQNLFGGSEGSATVSADIKKFPENETGINALPQEHRQMVRNYLATHPHDYGKGGNITLILEGGTMHNIFGGNDIKGDIDGVINIIVNDKGLDCPLNIDYIYGGNNQSIYEPQNIMVGGVSQKPVTPIVEVVNGTVNYDVFGGSLGGDATIVNAGKITCNPKVVIGDGTPLSTNEAHVGHIVHSGEDDVYYGEVFGGGSSGDVVGTTKVILQGKATIDKNVFGGAQRAQVTGNTNVILTPKMHKLTITQPTSGGTIAVYNSVGVQVNSGDDVPEDAYLRLVATPTAATSIGGYLFNQWAIVDGTGAGSIIDHLSWANSTFTMGTADATLTASFTSVPAKQLTMALGTAGAGSLFVDGHAYTSPVWVAENSSIRVQAIPSPTTSEGGYVFKRWKIAEGTGEGASISDTAFATTNFNMGTADATLRAYFDHLTARTLTIASSGLTGSASATFTVDGTTYSSPVYVAESTSVTVRVTPPEGYVFSGWSITGEGANIDNIVSPVTHCTVGTSDAILTATFTASSGRTNNNVNE